MPIRKRGNTWQVSVSFSGRRIRVSSGKGATREQAQELEAKIRRDLLADKLGKKPKRLISEALNYWLDGERKTLRGEGYENKVSHMIPFLQGRYLEDAPEVASQATRAWLAKGLKPATIRRRLAILRRVCNLAFKRWGWLDRHVPISLIGGEEHRHVYLTIEEAERLFSASPSRIAADVMRLAVLTGLRRGELLGLTGSNYYGDKLILDANTKNGRPRMVPLHPDAQAILRMRRVPLPITGGQVHFDIARKAAGLPHVRFHDLRHTCASWLVQRGAPLTAVRDLLGHSSLGITSRYAHLADQHLVDCIKLLPTRKT
jgi:integrase